MSHRDAHVAKRSASHGALNGSYTLPTRASSAILDSGHHLVPYFKPLRSIREHGHTFLDPAASADGMLRKTTETGDIGLFTISRERRPPLRPRASLGDLRQPHRPLSRSSDRPPAHGAHGDRKRTQAYRDSTSEIISMYGSDNHSGKSASGTLSPPWDDCGLRSYSMTTCGSKSYTLPRNMAMQQAHDVSAGAQRPRSPYPYPTRLPRPGIRPSSPALTENGNVDYSRMVEIDRIPQRTVHHPHKPLFPYKTTREQPPPLSMRHGANQSTHSLSDDHGPTHLLQHRTSRRPPLPNQTHPWGLRPRHRLGSQSSDQSMRTMSLTSTNGGYGSVPPQMPRLPLPGMKPPIFYDYSEDFEDSAHPPPDPPIVVPTPTRVSGCFRPGIQDDDCDVRSESADGGIDNVVDYLRRMTIIESGGEHEDEDQEGPSRHDDGYGLEYYRPVSQLHQRDAFVQPAHHSPGERAIISSPLLPRPAQNADASYISDVSLTDHQDFSDKAAPEGSSHVTDSMVHGLVSDASTAESPLGPETPGSNLKLALAEPTRYDDDDDDDSSLGQNDRLQYESNNENALPDEPVGSRMALPENVSLREIKSTVANFAPATVPYRYNNVRKDSRFYSVSSGLSDLASLVRYGNRHMQEVDCGIAEQDERPLVGSRSEPAANYGPHRCEPARETSAPPRKSSLANQRRSYAEPKTEGPALIDEIDRFHVVSTRSGPTLVPQPISPAKMLRLKNSVPQLMKSLPPLPSYSPASESPFNPTLVPVEFEPFDLSRLTDARSTLIDPLGPRKREQETLDVYDPFAFSRAVRKPRLKLKTPASHPTGQGRRTRPEQLDKAEGTSSEDAGTSQSTNGGCSMVPVKRRLPIKVSRSVMDLLAADDTGTVKRRPGFEKSSTVSELASSQPVDLFSTSRALERAVRDTVSPAKEQSPTSDREYGTLPVVKATPMAGIRRVTIIEEGRGASLDAQLDALHSPKPRTETSAEDGMQSFFSDSLVKPQRGLRKRLSNLKTRLAESRHHHAAPRLVPVDRRNSDDRAVGRSQSSSSTRDVFAEASPTKCHHAMSSTQTVKRRWEKLVKGARDRLRTWGKSRNKNE